MLVVMVIPQVGLLVMGDLEAPVVLEVQVAEAEEEEDMVQVVEGDHFATPAVLVVAMVAMEVTTVAAMAVA